MFFVFFTLVLPIILLLVSTQNSLFFLNSYSIFLVFFFLLPSIYLLKNSSFRNPYFLIPFTTSFCLGIIHLSWANFVKDWIIWLGFLQLLIGLSRTPRPWNNLLLRLQLTEYFKNFLEMEKFWRILVILICPVLIPLTWFVCTFLSWS